MTRRTKLTFLALLLLVIAGIAVTVVMFPVNKVAEQQVTSFLAARGITVSALTVNRLDFSGADISNLRISAPVKAGAEQVTLDFKRATFALKNAYQDSAGKHYAGDINGIYRLDLRAKTLWLDADVKGSSHPLTTHVTFDQNFGPASASALTLQSTVLQWAGGTVSAPKLTLALPLTKPTATSLRLRNVSLDALVKMGLSDKASGEGVVSGDLPLVIRPDGSFTFGEGLLQAGTSGIVRIPAGTLPSTNEQLTTVSSILADFHYTRFSIALTPTAGGDITVVLKLEGNNPAVYEGKPIKLNINLGGDVLHFVQLSLLPIVDPTLLLNKETP